MKAPLPAQTETCNLWLLSSMERLEETTPINVSSPRSGSDRSARPPRLT